VTMRWNNTIMACGDEMDQPTSDTWQWHGHWLGYDRAMIGRWLDHQNFINSWNFPKARELHQSLYSLLCSTWVLW
jgi:hypothetical protein